ncbi:MAG: gamma-glutamyl-gamma-aminobutyrate hydrolase family protein [Desulfotignum sp.]
MAARPLVGVTGSARRWAPAWWCTRMALHLAGASAMRITTRHGDSSKPLDALIIGGGNDISPEHYQGDLAEPVNLDPDRDLLEIRWIRYALHHKIPLLGICRGAQLINVVLGGNLHQDIRSLRRLTHNRPGLLPTKQVAVEKRSCLARICGSRSLRVNSLHHQAIREPGKGLAVVGKDLDGIIQAVERCDGQRIIGVQWHPEYLFYLPAQFALFRWLVETL